MRAEYEAEIKELRMRSFQEKENVRKGVHDMAETSKREELMLSTMILEITDIFTQMRKDKHKGLSATAAQKMLSTLEDLQDMTSLKRRSCVVLGEKEQEWFSEMKGEKKI